MAAKIKGYYFKDKKTGKKRNTAVFATSAGAAKKKLRRPSAENAVVYSVRTPKAGETKGGKWSRVRADGKSPKKSKYGKGRGFGPKR
ncbi:MAG: hypothetical protein ACRCYP_05895 [Alphaproteobacteria bacterium]